MCDIDRQKEVLTSEIKDINFKIEDIKKSCEMLNKEFLVFIMQVEKKNGMHLVVTFNSLKSTSDE